MGLMKIKTKNAWGVSLYSVSTNFRLEFIEGSSREVFIFWTLVEREERGVGFPFAHKIGVRIIVRTSGEGANE